MMILPLPKYIKVTVKKTSSCKADKESIVTAGAGGILPPNFQFGNRNLRGNN
jgi:hypothetical protein